MPQTYRHNRQTCASLWRYDPLMQRQFYTLAADGITPVPCDYATWLAWVESGADRAFLETQLPGERIVTEFRGFELTGGGLFQTQVFGIRAGGTQARYE